MRRMSCPFEDKSERQRSEELYNYTHTHTYTNRCVCAHAHVLTHTHANTNTLTDLLPRAHSAPRVAEQGMLGCLDTNAVIREGMR